MINKFDTVVVIPFYNEEKFIEKTLSCIVKQKVLPKISWHVLFVNNRSSDNSDQIIKRFFRKARISYSLIEEKRRGTVYSRKTGLVEASELSDNIIISTDADTTFSSHFIQTTRKDLERSSGDILVGKRKKTPEVELWKRVISGNTFNLKRKLWNLEYSYFGPYFYGAYFAIKTNFFKRIPLFNPEEHEKYLGEDVLLSKRSHYIGGKFVKSSLSVTPDERRTIRFQEKALDVYVGNITKSYFQEHTLKELNFKKLNVTREKQIIRGLISFQAKRFMWLVCDAYVFWLKTGKQYKRAYQIAKKGMDFIGLSPQEFYKIGRNLTLSKMFDQINKRQFRYTVSKIGEYINA